MKFLRIFVFFLALSAFALTANETPGMLAFLERNYGAALRLLPKEIAQFVPGSDTYLEHVFAYIESALFYGRTDEAAERIDEVKSQIPSKYQTRFDLLCAQLAFARKNFAECEKILDKIPANAALSPLNRYDIAVLYAEIYLTSNRAEKTLEIVRNALRASEVAQCGEFTLRIAEMRALASVGKIGEILPIYENLKKKYPGEKEKIRHFELLALAIKQDLKAYHELFIKLFPDEKSFAPYIGDMVLYQGTLLSEQQARTENNKNEIIFNLKNQTWLAPSDEYRIASYRELIDILIKNNRKKEALHELQNMLKKIPSLPEKSVWEFLSADLQNELNIGDRGLNIYLKIKNDSSLADSMRANAAKNAAAIYKSLGQKTEMLKLYAFLAEMPNAPEINNEGVLLAGKYYFSNHEYRMGESILGKIMPASSFYPEALFYLIQCKIANGEFTSATADVKLLADLKNNTENPELPEFALAALYFQAQIAEAEKDFETSAALYEKAARTSSKRHGAQTILCNSFLKAAQINFNRNLYSQSGLLFLTFAEHYPNNPEAAQALYNSVYSYFLAGRFEEMQYSIDKLKKSHPDSPLTVNALFHQMDYMRQNDNLQKALDILAEIESLNKDKNAEITAQLIYDKALTYYQLHRESDALKELETLNNLAGSVRKDSGFFLAGTILSEQSEYQKSAENFLKAADAFKDFLLKNSARCRAADNYFLAGTKNRDNSLLRLAADIYANAVKNDKNPPIFRLQCLYKWGRTLEAMSDFQGALDAYTEALYLPLDSDTAANGVSRIWINRCALNAIDINLHQGGSNALTDALFIIRRLKNLNTMSGKELADLENNVRRRYIQQD